MNNSQKQKPDLSLTEEEYQNIAKVVFGKTFSKLINYYAENYSNEKLGFTCLHHRLKLAVQLDNE